MSIEEELTKLTRENNIRVAELTEEQLVEALRQAITCGDFMRYVQQNAGLVGATAVVYLPYQRCTALESTLRHTREKLAEVEQERNDLLEICNVLKDRLTKAP